MLTTSSESGNYQKAQLSVTFSEPYDIQKSFTDVFKTHWPSLPIGAYTVSFAFGTMYGAFVLKASEYFGSVMVLIYDTKPVMLTNCNGNWNQLNLA